MFGRGRQSANPRTFGGLVSHDQGRGVPPADPRGGDVPRVQSVVPSPDDSTTANAWPRHDAGGGGPSNLATRVSIRTVAVRVDGDRVLVDAEE
jgi:hypothetical protein